MSLKEWLTRFQAQHQRARAGTLDADGWASYRAGREELARALMAAQKASLKPGEAARQGLRVARAIQADLEWSVEKVRVVTLDVSAGGFGALLARAPPSNEDVRVQLRMPGGEALLAKARVVGVQVGATSSRVSFCFSEIGAAERERMEMLVYDTVLSQLTI
jgi:hypothetical protein